MRIERLARIRFRYRSPHIPLEVVSFRFEVSSVLGLSALNESSVSFSGALKMNGDERTYTDNSFSIATALLNVSYMLLRRQILTLSSSSMFKLSIYTPTGKERSEVQGMTIFRLFAKLDLMTKGSFSPRSDSMEVRFNSTFCRFSSWLRIPNAILIDCNQSYNSP